MLLARLRCTASNYCYELPMQLLGCVDRSVGALTATSMPLKLCRGCPFSFSTACVSTHRCTVVVLALLQLFPLPSPSTMAISSKKFEAAWGMTYCTCVTCVTCWQRPASPGFPHPACRSGRNESCAQSSSFSWQHFGLETALLQLGDSGTLTLPGQARTSPWLQRPQDRPMLSACINTMVSSVSLETRHSTTEPSFFPR